MLRKTVKCPICNAVLDVKNPDNEEEKRITCPNCKTLLQVKFRKRQEPIEAQTFYMPRKPAVDDDVKTQLAGGSNGATQLAKRGARQSQKASLQVGDISYPLEDGLNIVGRKSSSCKATVQIDTTDRYMSRQHCSITISTLPDGTKKAVLSNYQNKNLTTVDGVAVETEDAIRLFDGNNIMMGHSVVTFKLS